MSRRLPVFHLRLEEHDGGAVGVTLSGAATAHGVVPAEAMAEALAAVDALPKKAAVLVNAPSQLRRWDHAEDRAGLALGRALGAAGPVLPELQTALAEAERVGERALVLVDPCSARLRALPWELSSVGEPAVRLWNLGVLGRAGLADHALIPEVRTGPRLRHLLWAPQVQDEVVGALRLGLMEGAAKAGLPIEEVTLGVWPPPGLPSVDVLHVAAHGERVDGELMVRLDGGAPPIPVRSFTEALAVLARRVALVALWSCHGAGWDDEALETVAGRLIALGAPAVLAPAVEIPSDWARPWLETFNEAMRQQATVLEAASVGRGKLALHQRAEPRCRAHLTRLIVGPQGARQDPRLYWMPAGWPAVAAELAELLTAAWEVAEERGHGFVGVEHVLLAILGGRALGPLETGLLGPLLPSVEVLSARLGSWSARGPARSPLATPRLLGWGARVSEGASPEAFWQVIADDLLPAVARVSLDPGATLRTLVTATSAGGPAHVTAPPTLKPPTGLEVVGGPEDGRILRPRKGQTVGRFDPLGDVVADWALYAESAAWDLSLSRKHLMWLGPGRVRLMRSGHALSRMGGVMRLPEGERALLVGDLIQLTRGTALRALP